MYSDMITVPAQILAQAKASPRAVAVECAGDRLTYAELVAQAGGLADHLRRIGVRPGDLVAVAVPRGVDMVPTLIGVQLAGAAYLPMDPEHPADRLNYILADSGARVLVTVDATGSPGLRAPARVHLNDVPVRPDPAPPPALHTYLPAYVIYTSGSTGRPKGVLVNHGALTNFIRSMRECLGLPDDVVLPAVTTVSFDIAGLELFLPLTTGGRVVVGQQIEASDPHRLSALLERTGARVLQATPVTWRLLLSAGWSPSPGFTVLCGGERLPGELAERLLGDGVVLWDLYGPTETTIWSAATRYERGAPARFHPVRETPLHLLDERLEPVPQGTVGELYIGGAGLAVGYLGRPALTAERFVADPFAAVAGARLYRTGDVARRHPDGRIEILGRVDHQIKIRGFRVEPGEIENVLSAHPGVAEAAVRAIDDTGGAPRLVGYVRATDPAEPPDPRRLQRHLARSVPAYMVPTQFVVLAAFPTTHNGKLDRSALPVPPPLPRPDELVAPAPSAGNGASDNGGPDGGGPDSGGPADSQTGRRVAEVLAAVLERTEIGPHEDFFALGGDSLRAVQAILRLNAELQTQVPINALFEARTVYGLAALLDGASTDEPQLLPLAEGQAPRLSSAQWRLWLHQRLAPHSVAYNEPLAVRLPDPLDVDALRAALTDLLARHDILRTRYEPDESGRPVPVVWPVTPAHLEVEDGDPRAVLAAELARPFDLATEAPIRARLVRRGDADSAVLLLVLHEIAADDRSRELIAGQLRAAYRGRTVPTPAVRYADYAAWQRELAASGTARRHLDFWQTALAGLQPAELLTDRPRSAQRDWRGATVRFALPPDVVGKLRDVAFEHDATLSMGLLAGFYGVLGRYTKGADVTVGVPVAGRDRPELEDLVGMLEHTAVIRVDLGGRPTFEQLLARVRESGLAAFGRAAPPLEDIVAAVLDSVAAPEPGRNPLFDILFTPHGVGEPAGFPLPDAPGARIDLRCDLTERADGGVDGRFDYATQLFDEATIARLAGDYVALLAEVAEDPTRLLEEVPTLDRA
jgi:amino acid adenylation domain-containing protein